MTAMAAPYPRLDTRTVVTILLSGLAADITWEIWARLITPLWVGGPLEPAALVRSVFGIQSQVGSESIHILTGLVFYPAGYLFIALPILRAVVPSLPWWLAGTLYGVALWIFALFVMAGLVAGLPYFLGFIPLTWASLVGHVLFALALALVVQWRREA
jgi:hypothetical protein